jgi:methylglutaconyl-CoA hydratase
VADVARQPLNAQLIADTAERISVTRAGAEAREGLKAFLEKRRPDWVKG